MSAPAVPVWQDYLGAAESCLPLEPLPKDSFFWKAGSNSDLSGHPVTGQENFGGAMVMASGLVFVSGTSDRKIRAFDAESGKELWSFRMPMDGTAPPASDGVEEGNSWCFRQRAVGNWGRRRGIPGLRLLCRLIL